MPKQAARAVVSPDLLLLAGEPANLISGNTRREDEGDVPAWLRILAARDLLTALENELFWFGLRRKRRHDFELRLRALNTAITAQRGLPEPSTFTERHPLDFRSALSELSAVAESLVPSLRDAFGPLRQATLTLPPVASLATVHEGPRMNRRVRAIAALQRALDKEPNGLLYVLVHGSYGDRTALPGWSDLDVVWVFPDGPPGGTWQSFARSMSRLNMTCYWVDALAHHRFFPMMPWQRRALAEADMPLLLFRDGYGLFSAGLKELEFTILDDRLLRARRFAQYAIDLAVENPAHVGTAFNWKEFLCRVFLLPTMYLAAVKGPLSKKESFVAIREHLDSASQAVLDRLSIYRRSWHVRNPVLTLPVSLGWSLPPPAREGLTHLNRRLAGHGAPWPDASERTEAVLQARVLASALLSRFEETSIADEVHRRLQW